MLAHGVLSNHTSNLTSSQSLGVSCKNQALGWREVEDLMFWRRGWSGRERGVNEGGEGVYILPPPKVTVVCFLVEPGSSAVTSDHPG